MYEYQNPPRLNWNICILFHEMENDVAALLYLPKICNA